MTGSRDGAAYRRARLADAYPDEFVEPLAREVEQRLSRPPTRATAGMRWDESDAWFITYPDQFTEATPDGTGPPPLAALRRFVAAHLSPWLTGLHVTPFAPWTSDEGYSIVDLLAVDERYGTWEDVEALAADHRLMVDAVVNHLSAESDWFADFLAGAPDRRNFFRTADPDADLSATARPRATPLLTRFEAAGGPRWVWTTFSADQVDLDFANPRVLLAILDVLLTYADRGAQALRLDAIAYLWKREGTSSLHLPETHAIVQFLRSALTSVYPNLVIVTETNVPHEENVSYFGTGARPGAHAVYQFALPPLTLHALLTGDAGRLRSWARTVTPPRADTTFLNFLASHDGVGLRPAEGLLDADDVDLLVRAAERSGGQVSLRTLADGTTSPYELNATWFSLLAADGADGPARHLASHAIMLALQGLPLLYVHSLFASGNDLDGFARSGRPRSLNRRRFAVSELERELDDPGTRAARTWRALREMLTWRASSPAFHPSSAQQVLDTGPRVFAVERAAPTGAGARVYVNVSGDMVRVPVAGEPGWSCFADGAAVGADLELAPHGYRWLRR